MGGSDISKLARQVFWNDCLKHVFAGYYTSMLDNTPFCWLNTFILVNTCLFWDGVMMNVS
jgi:hypothetical protein